MKDTSSGLVASFPKIRSTSVTASPVPKLTRSRNQFFHPLRCTGFP